MRYFLVATLFAIASCQVPTRISMEGEGGRTAYNIAIQMTNSQQMLLNLVRLRYADSPLFLDVSSITTQNTFRSEISPVFPIPGFSEENPFKLGTDFMWQAQPTITYAPLEGAAFAERLLRPISLRTIQLLCYSGWNVDRIFRMMIQHIADLSNTPEIATVGVEKSISSQNFAEVGKLLRYFQKRGELQVGVKYSDAKDGEVGEKSMQIVFPEEGTEAHRLAELLHSEHKEGKYVNNLDLGFNQIGYFGVMPRSILSCMYYLSHGVIVPQEDFSKALVPDPNPEEMAQSLQESFSDLITIKWCHFNPQNAFISVKYHNYWFYIDESDLLSKKTFALLLQLYNLNAIAPKNSGPILTLPLR